MSLIPNSVYAKYTMIGYFGPSIVKEMLPFGGEAMSLRMVDIKRDTEIKRSRR
jgi:hypothetical protein